MKSFFLSSVVSKRQAVEAIQTYQSNWITRWQKLLGKKTKLKSIEMVYVPYWCHDYEYTSEQIKDPILGKVAVETVKNLTAILPSTACIEPLEDTGDKQLLKVSGEPDAKVAEQAIYWEAFAREKKRKNIHVTIDQTNILYVPYWIGYLQGEKIEPVIVDATSGKVDLGIKDSIIYSLMENETTT